MPGLFYRLPSVTSPCPVSTETLKHPCCLGVKQGMESSFYVPWLGPLMCGLGPKSGAINRGLLCLGICRLRPRCRLSDPTSGRGWTGLDKQQEQHTQTKKSESGYSLIICRPHFLIVDSGDQRDSFPPLRVQSETWVPGGSCCHCCSGRSAVTAQVWIVSISLPGCPFPGPLARDSRLFFFVVFAFFVLFNLGPLSVLVCRPL